ncbi:MAG: phosphoribosylanthranilate isomerase [Campylobacteraceae bacterium]|jgi:phosphoribosylanthranilate isomerase|nr:phosphoribosylanthranilate isomerase [Campylobacteraceae bacterium]
MRVKICGITSLEDALSAVDAGADAIGFIFYSKSPRYITLKEAKKISASLPPFVQKIGVFVNESPKNIDRICKKAKLNFAQLHFDVDEKFLSKLKIPHIKVIRAKEMCDVLKYNDEYRLIDAFVDSFGGEGKSIDLSWFEGVDCSKIILAGGLHADMLESIKHFGFYGVDVSSGVELSYGKKDAQKVYEFVKSAKIEAI